MNIKISCILFFSLISCLGSCDTGNDSKSKEETQVSQKDGKGELENYTLFAEAFCACHRDYFSIQDSIEAMESSDLEQLEAGVNLIRKVGDNMTNCLDSVHNLYAIEMQREKFPEQLVKVLEKKCPRLFTDTQR